MQKSSHDAVLSIFKQLQMLLFLVRNWRNPWSVEKYSKIDAALEIRNCCCCRPLNAICGNVLENTLMPRILDANTQAHTFQMQITLFSRKLSNAHFLTSIFYVINQVHKPTIPFFIFRCVAAFFFLDRQNTHKLNVLAVISILVSWLFSTAQNSMQKITQWFSDFTHTESIFIDQNADSLQPFNYIWLEIGNNRKKISQWDERTRLKTTRRNQSVVSASLTWKHTIWAVCWCAVNDLRPPCRLSTSYMCVRLCSYELTEREEQKINNTCTQDIRGLASIRRRASLRKKKMCYMNVCGSVAGWWARARKNSDYAAVHVYFWCRATNKQGLTVDEYGSGGRHGWVNALKWTNSV